MATLRDIFVRIGVKTDDADLDRLSGKFETFKKRAKIAGLVLAGAFAGFSGWAAKLAADFEQTEIAFETMLGSAEKSKQLLKDLRQLAAESPFTFLETTKHAKKLLAYGIEGDKVVETMKMLGNIASGVGKDRLPFLTLALGQIRAKGVLAGQELRQLTETGIPIIDELAKTTGFSKAQITDQTKDLGITFQQVENAMKRMTSEGGKFYNLMARQNKSTLGQLSNIMDVLEEVGTDFGKALLESLKPIIVGFREWLELNKEIIKTKFVEFAKNLQFVFRGVVGTFNLFSNMVRWLVERLGGLDTVLNAIFWSIVAIAGGAALGALGSAFLAIPGMIATILGALTLLNAKIVLTKALLFAIPILVGVLVAGIALLIEDLYTYFTGGDSITGRLAEMFPVFQKILDFIKLIGKTIATFFVIILTRDINLIKNAFVDLGNSILEFFGTTGQRIGEFWADQLLKLVTWLENMYNKVADFIGRIADKIFSPIDKLAKLAGIQLGGSSVPSLAPSGAGNSNNQTSVNVTSPINVNVPPGVNTEEVGGYVSEALGEFYNTQLFQAKLATESGEVQ